MSHIQVASASTAGRVLTVTDPDLETLAYAGLHIHLHYPYLNLRKNDKATPKSIVMTNISENNQSKLQNQFIKGLPQIIRGYRGR